MKTNQFTKFLALSLFFVFMFTGLQAQIFKDTPKRVEKSAERKAEQRVENKADRAIDEGLNAIEGLFKKKNKKKKKGTEEEEDVEVQVNEDGSINAGDVQVSFEEDDSNPADAEPNSWKGRFTMEMIEYKKNGEEKDRTVTTMHFDTYQSAFVTQDNDEETSIAIFDKRYKTMTTKTESNGNKSAVVIKMPKVKVNTDEVYDDMYDADNLPRATGEFKTINGQYCQRWEYEDDEMVTEAWIAENSSMSMMDVFNAVNLNPTGKAAQVPKGSAYSFQGGMVVQATSVDKSSGRKTVTNMKDIVEGGQSSEVFDLSGYQVTKVPSLGNMFQQKN